MVKKPAPKTKITVKFVQEFMEYIHNSDHDEFMIHEYSSWRQHHNQCCIEVKTRLQDQ